MCRPWSGKGERAGGAEGRRVDGARAGGSPQRQISATLQLLSCQRQWRQGKLGFSPLSLNTHLKRATALAGSAGTELWPRGQCPFDSSQPPLCLLLVKTLAFPCLSFSVWVTREPGVVSEVGLWPRVLDLSYCQDLGIHCSF